MVQAIISIQDETNRVLNMVKAKYGLKDKSAAIDKMAEEYQNEILEPELKPEFVAEMKKIGKQKPIYVGTVANLKKRIEAKNAQAANKRKT